MDVGVEVGEGQGHPWERTLPPISLAPVPRAGPSTPPSPRTFTRHPSPWLLGNTAKGLMQIPPLQAQPQNPGPVPALELQGPY